MIDSCKTLTSFTEDKFLAKAWADYLKEVNDNWSNLMSAVTEASTYELDDGETTSHAVDQVLSQFGLNGGENVCLSKGFTNVRDLLTYTITQTEKFGDVEDPDSSSALLEQALSLVKNDGSASSAKSSLVEVYDDLKSSYHSATVLQAAFESLDGTTISDRVTVFKDKVQAKFTNVFDDISASFNVFEDMIGTGFTNVSTFIGNVVNYMGVQQQATNNDFTLNSSDLSQYTGANPLPAVDFTSAGKAIGAVGKVVGQAVWSLVKGIGNVAGKIFSWIGKKVESAAVPYDLEILDDNAVGYTIDGWGMTSQANSAGTPTCNGEYGCINLSDSQMDSMISAINRQKDRWIKLNFIGCEYIFKIRDDATYNERHSVSIPIMYKYKPKPIRYSVVKSALINHGFTVTDRSLNPDNIDGFDVSARSFNNKEEMDNAVAAVIEEIKNADYLIDPKKDSELDAYNAFLTGAQLSMWVTDVAELLMYLDDNAASNYFKTPAAGFSHINGSAYTVTNKMWVMMASGWNGDFGSATSFGSSMPLLGSSSIVVNGAITKMVTCFALQQWDKQVRPTNFIFLPYQNDVADFDNSKFTIKTDAANQEALTKFMTAVVTIVIVVAVAIFTGVKIRKLKRAKFFKRLEFTSQMDSMMWEGGSMTSAQRRKYIKYSRKLNASSLLTGGLQESASNALSSIFSTGDTTTTTVADQSYDVITKLIR